MVTAETALAGRDERGFSVPSAHYVLSTPLEPPYPEGAEVAYFGMGCFWGAEQIFWNTKGVINTAVGYEGGFTANPTYDEVCSGRTGHSEIVKVIFDPKQISYADLLKVFWENHDPTQGMRQGNDVGTQYRSAIYATTDAQLAEAQASAKVYGEALKSRGFGPITTEIREGVPFYFAEGYHQQYLAKNPADYCGVGGTGVSCPIGTGVHAA
jgi:peptide-methionine (S)-S-oxide reductase